MSTPFLYRRSTWRGTFFDLWTLPHVISGMLIAHVALIFEMSFGAAFWMALAIGVGWELFERITHLSRTEAYTNSLGDIVGAHVGFMMGWGLFSYITDGQNTMIVVLLLCALFALICFFGWRAFRYYG